MKLAAEMQSLDEKFGVVCIWRGQIMTVKGEVENVENFFHSCCYECLGGRLQDYNLSVVGRELVELVCCPEGGMEVNNQSCARLLKI